MTSPSELVRTAGRAAVGLMAVALLATVATPLAAQEEEEAARDRPAEHEVDRGDTLWDLAGRYLTDPFSWPRIFEINQDVVEDPHWIYPGEVLQLPGPGTAADVTGVEVAQRDRARPDTAREVGPRDERPAGADPFGGPSIFDRNPSQSVMSGGFTVEDAAQASLVSRSTFYGAGFLASYRTVRPRGTLARIIEENPLGLEIPPSARIGDEVILSLDGLGVAEGDTLQAVQRDRGVGGGLSVVRSQGLLQIQSVSGDSARANVLKVYGNLAMGDHLIRAEPYTVGDVYSLRPTDDGLRARVRALAVDQPLVATGDLVFLDVGSSSDVSVGDEFAVFSRDVSDPAAEVPRDRLGVVRVVRVRGNTSTARVTDVRDMGIGVGAPALRIRRPAPTGP